MPMGLQEVGKAVVSNSGRYCPRVLNPRPSLVPPVCCDFDSIPDCIELERKHRSGH